MHHPYPHHMEALDSWAVKLRCDGNTDFTLPITVISCVVWQEKSSHVTLLLVDTPGHEVLSTLLTLGISAFAHCQTQFVWKAPD